MKFFAITCLVALAVSTHANDFGYGPVYAPGHTSLDYYSYPKYAFEYAVKDPHTGDNKSQWEKRDGDVVKGAYSLVEPDGNLRTVEYWADDKSGFNAVVKRTGPNLHPTVIGHGPDAAVAPIYKAPIPILEPVGPVAPIHVGSVAGLSGLVNAPLLNGKGYGTGYSTASIVNYIAPAKAAPLIVPEVPIVKAPLYNPYILKGPIAPVYKEPLYNSYPVYKEPFLHSYPILKTPLPYGPIGNYGPIGYNSVGHGIGSIGHGYDSSYLDNGYYSGYSKY